MTTVLQYLVIAAVIGLVLFGIALLIFGRGEQMAALPARTSPAQLPTCDITGGDVRKVRFALAVRGYRMSDVDWTLDRLADELDRAREKLSAIEGTAAVDPKSDDEIDPSENDDERDDRPAPTGGSTLNADVLGEGEVDLFIDDQHAPDSPQTSARSDRLVPVEDGDVVPDGRTDLVPVEDEDLVPGTGQAAGGPQVGAASTDGPNTSQPTDSAPAFAPPTDTDPDSRPQT